MIKITKEMTPHCVVVNEERNFFRTHNSSKISLASHKIKAYYYIANATRKMY